MHDHDRGLAFDLPRLVDRRGALRLLAGVGALAVAGCSADDGPTSAARSGAPEGTQSPTTAAASAGGTSTTGATTCEAVPKETAGPFPGDGTNGPNALADAGVVRSDIRTSLGPSSGRADGVPLTLTLQLQDARAGCRPLAGAAVYLWHCDREGRYSMYDLPDESYLRGVQAAGPDGSLRFTTTFPGCYPGRWPHVHFEVFPSLAAATTGRGARFTSQLALPSAACEQAFAAEGYGASARQLARTSLARDGVFADTGGASQLATVTGDAVTGFTGTFRLTI